MVIFLANCVIVDSVLKYHVLESENSIDRAFIQMGEVE